MGLMPGAALTLISGPTAEPISLTEAKAHLRVTTTDEDDLISGLITAAREFCEEFQNRAYVTQIWELTLDSWPCHDYIELPLPPLRSVSSVKFRDTAGAESTWAASEYFVNKARFVGRVVRGYGKSWPTATLLPSGAIAVRFVCGYATPFTADAATNTLIAPGHPYRDDDVVRLSNSGGALPGGLSERTDYYIVNATSTTVELSATPGGPAMDISDAGSGTSFLGEVPARYRQAMKLLIGHWNENREAVLTGSISKQLEFTVESLLGPDRVL